MSVPFSWSFRSWTNYSLTVTRRESACNGRWIDTISWPRKFDNTKVNPQDDAICYKIIQTQSTGPQRRCSIVCIAVARCWELGLTTYVYLSQTGVWSHAVSSKVYTAQILACFPTPWVKKVGHPTLAHNFAICWLIFKILSPRTQQ